MNRTKFTYMLRRVLPMWKPREVIEETVEFCRANSVD